MECPRNTRRNTQRATTIPALLVDSTLTRAPVDFGLMISRVLFGLLVCISLPAAEPTAKTPPRPRLRDQSRAPGAQGEGNRTAVLGLDARWAEHGQYLQGLIEQIQSRWFAILDESRVQPKKGTRATVTFTLSADGKVTIVKTDGDAGRLGIKACVAALTAGPQAPKWSEAMIAQFGREATLTFTFFYH